MPELPEVEIVRRYLEERALGKRIDSVKVIGASILEGVTTRKLIDLLVGKCFTAARRHGKQLFLQVDGGFLTAHLGMTGDLIVIESESPLPRFARIVVGFQGGERLVFEDMRKFGAVGFVKSTSSLIMSKGLGPDMLLVQEKEFLGRVRRHRKAIKTVLLDQRVVAGIGNLYADEALFQSGIHPSTSASDLTDGEVEKLCRNVRRVLKRSIQVRTDFDRLPRTFLLRSRIEGGRCPRGHSSLKSIKVGGRTTTYCPRCQRPLNG